MAPRKKVTPPPRYNLRMREDLRQRLEGEAKQKDLSLNDVIIERLQSSLDDEASFYKQIGDKHTVNLMKLISAMINTVESRLGKHWHSDHKTSREVHRQINNMLSLTMGEIEDTGVTSELKPLVDASNFDKIFADNAPPEQILRIYTDIAVANLMELRRSLDAFESQSRGGKGRPFGEITKEDIARYVRENPSPGGLLGMMGDASRPEPDRDAPPADETSVTSAPKRRTRK